MTTEVHPTAVIEEGARIGSGCIIHAYAVIRARSVLDEKVVVHPFAVIGGEPQDLGFVASTSSGVWIGAHTVIREHVTVSRATKAGASTVIGSDCFLMAASHVAHDCRIGSRVIVANAALLAGHVQIGDRAFLGGGTVVHQFCRIGEGAMIGGGARIGRDVPPFCLATERHTLIGLNVVGLRRRGTAREAFNELKRAYRLMTQPVGNLREIAAAAMRSDEFSTAEARAFLEFFQGGRRAFARPRRGAGETEDSE